MDASAVTISMQMDQMRSDLVRGLVWFVNYAALDPSGVKVDQLDLHGTGMLPQDVELFAHRWLAFSPSIDIQHDGIGRNVKAIESFFNAPEIASPAFPINSHAARLDVSGSKEAMDGLKNGSLNSVSLDALTFNKVVRLPVAASAKSAPSDAPVPMPSTLSEWAREIACSGYDGVQSVREVSPGLYIAMRAGGLPLGISIDGDSIEVSPVCNGPWAHLGAALFESPTLTSAKMSAPMDHGPWDSRDASAALEGIGVRREFPRPTPLEFEAFAVVQHVVPGFAGNGDSRGLLLHHTVRNGVMVPSKQGVIDALSQLHTIPLDLRPAAEAHLRAHLQECS